MPRNTKIQHNAAPQQSVPQQSATNARKEAVNYRDVAMQYLIHGADAVLDLHRAKGISEQTFTRAIDYLPAAQREGLDQLRGEILPPDAVARGRRGVEIGAVRTYAVQRTGTTGDDAWIKVPVHTLGAQRGHVITATFRDGEIVLTAR